MFAALVDTHTLIWWLQDSPRLSVTAANYLEACLIARQRIAVSSITLVEVVYLVEKGRISAETFTAIAQILSGLDGLFSEMPVTLEIARTMSRIDAQQVPDMPDRIIAATALYLRVPVISKDAKIQQSNIQTIW